MRFDSRNRIFINTYIYVGMTSENNNDVFSEECVKRLCSSAGR